MDSHRKEFVWDGEEKKRRKEHKSASF